MDTTDIYAISFALSHLLVDYIELLEGKHGGVPDKKFTRSFKRKALSFKRDCQDKIDYVDNGLSSNNQEQSEYNEILENLDHFVISSTKHGVIPLITVIKEFREGTLIVKE